MTQCISRAPGAGGHQLVPHRVDSATPTPALQVGPLSWVSAPHGSLVSCGVLPDPSPC